MTYGEYIEPLFSTGFFGKNKAEFGQRLFLAAGPIIAAKKESGPGISISTVKTWLKHPEKCRVGSYFPDSVINEGQFIRFLKSYTKGHNMWQELQKAFLVRRSSNPTASDFCVDLNTEDSELFYWSLLNQFQRIFHLPETEQNVEDLTVPVLGMLHEKPLTERVRDIFLEDVRYFSIMEIINRKPVILNRTDSACMNTFLDKIDILAQNRCLDNTSLGTAINAFMKGLRIQALTLDAGLNSKFAFDDENASFNMEDDEDWAEGNEKQQELGIPELSLELILEAADPVALAELAVMEWGNFRDKMNRLIEYISSWRDKQ